MKQKITIEIIVTLALLTVLNEAGFVRSNDAVKTIKRHTVYE